MPEERKYCQGECGTILSDPSYLPHRKFCNTCNEKRAIRKSKIFYIKHSQKYFQQRSEKRQLKELEVQNA